MSGVEAAQRPWWVRLVGWLGLVAHLVLLFWYVASGLLAPGWAVLLLLLIWAALLVLALRLRRRRPLLTPLVPLVGLAVWFFGISAGEAWLGWTG
jgi:Flp pilus assembly protein TadB